MQNFNSAVPLDAARRALSAYIHFEMLLHTCECMFLCY
jgi:hypothetical protein